MIAHSKLLKELAASAGRPSSQVLQCARTLGQNGLYDRPGKGARNPRITLSSLANVALAMAGPAVMTADVTVRQMRPLVPMGTRKSRSEPENKLVGWKDGTNYLERFVDKRPIWSGANLGEFIEELIDFVAAAGAAAPWREAESSLVDFFRDAKLEFRLPEADGPVAELIMFMPIKQGERPRYVWSCTYLPPEADDVPPKLYGPSRGVIRFAFVETLGKLWREARAPNEPPSLYTARNTQRADVPATAAAIDAGIS